LRLREPEAQPARPHLWPLLRRTFLVPVVILAMAFAFLVDVSEAFLQPMSYPFLQRQLGYSAERVAYLATLGGLVGVAGSLLGGVLSDRSGRRRALFLGCGAVALTNFAFAAGKAWWPSYPFVLASMVASQLAAGVTYAAFIALFMDLTNPRLGATHFQVYMSIWNLRTSGAIYAGGHVADHLAPRSMFVLGGVLELLPLALLPLLDSRRAQASFAAADQEQSGDPVHAPPT
jgi:MFS family permease